MAFDHPVITEEDRNRNAYYTQAQEFGRELSKAVSLEEFVAGLQVRANISRLVRRRCLARHNLRNAPIS